MRKMRRCYTHPCNDTHIGHNNNSADMHDNTHDTLYYVSAYVPKGTSTCIAACTDDGMCASVYGQL